MEPETQAVETDSAPVIAPIIEGGYLPLKDMSPDQRTEWRKTGARPPARAATASTDVVTESSTVTEPEEAPAATAATSTADSDPADPAGYKAKTAKRFAELLENNRALTKRLEALERTPAPASSPVSATDDPEPNADTYDDLSKWMREHARWSAREELRARDAATATHTRDQAAKAEVEGMQARWNERVTAATTKYKDFDAKAINDLIPPRSIVDAFVQDLEPDAAATLMYHLHKNPAEMPRLLNLPPMRQLAELTRLTDKVTVTPRAKLQTSAPEPGPVLGARATAGDASVAAVKKGDFRAFRDEENRREIARKKGQ